MSGSSSTVSETVFGISGTVNSSQNLSMSGNYDKILFYIFTNISLIFHYLVKSESPELTEMFNNQFNAKNSQNI